jgi:hypothetical protein
MGIRVPVFSLTVDEYSRDIAIAIGSEIHIAKELQLGWYGEHLSVTMAHYF